MARLCPYPFAALVRRVFREIDRRQTIFDLPARAFFVGGSRKDLSVRFHGLPLAPAAALTIYDMSVPRAAVQFLKRAQGQGHVQHVEGLDCIPLSFGEHNCERIGEVEK